MSRISAPLWIAFALVTTGAACGRTVTLEGSGTTGAGGAAGEAGSSAQGGAGLGDTSAQGGAETGGGGAGGSAAGGGSVGGGSAGSGPTGGGGAGGAMICPGKGDPCTGCLSAQCPDVYCACAEEIHCFGYLECLGTCAPGDAPCAQNCAAVHEPGISRGILAADCAATVCDADCKFGKALNDCQKCLHTKCPDQMSACIADPECLALVQCTGMCALGDAACVEACVFAHPMGLGKAQDVRDCRIVECDSVCQP